jgi:hypothetical protein
MRRACAVDMLASVRASSLTDESVLVIAPEKKLKHNEVNVISHLRIRLSVSHALTISRVV